MASPKPLKTEEFIKKYSLLNKPVEIIGEYVNCKTKIKCKCLICGDTFEITPDCLMQGQIHKPCAMKLVGAKKLSNTETFKQKLLLVNSNIKVIGEYIKAKDKIDVVCKICGHEFKNTPNDLLNGQGCPKCAKHIVRTIEELYHQIEENSKNNVTLLSPILSSNKKVGVKCNICKYEWMATPITLIRCGCPNCDRIKRTKSHDIFVDELKLINPSIKILGKYRGQNSKIECECLNDGYIWEASPNNLLKGTGCPICKESKGERKCRLFFERNNIDFIQQKTYDGLVGLNNGLLRYDFYLPKYNLLIEYQGEFHEGKSNDFIKSFFTRQHNHDVRKQKYAKEHNIKLLEIWYWDFKNIEKILSRELGLAT